MQQFLKRTICLILLAFYNLHLKKSFLLTRLWLSRSKKVWITNALRKSSKLESKLCKKYLQIKIQERKLEKLQENIT